MNHLFLSFYNLKNLFRHKEYLGKQKGSSGVKGSLLNQLDNKKSLLYGIVKHLYF